MVHLATRAWIFSWTANGGIEGLSPTADLINATDQTEESAGNAMTDLGSGKYQVSLTPTVGEFYYIRVNVNGLHLPGPTVHIPAISTATAASGAAVAEGDYTNTLQVVRVAGIGLEIVDENVGTGDDAEVDYDLDNKNVIAGSVTLYHGASGSNSMSDLIETTHYTLDLDSARILLTSAGVTELGTDILYAKYIHSEKMSNTYISSHIIRAEAELELLTGRQWDEFTAVTEFFDGRENSFANYPNTEQPYMIDFDEPDFVVLKFGPVDSIQSAMFLARGDSFGNVFSTDGATFTDNTSEANTAGGTAFDTWPGPTASTDFLYIGMGFQFLSAIFDFSTLGVGSHSLVVQYWNGSTWATLSVTDNTSAFTADGKIFWDLPSGWVKNSVNSSNLFWVRFSFTGSISTNPTIFEIAPSGNDTISRNISLAKIDFTDYGRVTFIRDRFPNGVRNIRVDYTYGSSSVPTDIQELAAILTTLRVFVSISGGSFDDVTGYTMGSKQVSIGEAWVNIREVLTQMEKRKEAILVNRGKRNTVIA